MKHFYGTYVSSFYYRNIHAEIPNSYHHEDNVLIAAEDPEEARYKVETWIISKHRELDRMDEPFAMQRKCFIGGWKEKQNGWRWYEANACDKKGKGKLCFFYGYIYAPNKKFVEDKIKELGYLCILCICRTDWNEYIK